MGIGFRGRMDRDPLQGQRGTISSRIGELPPSDIDVPTSFTGAMVLMRTRPALPRVPRKNR